MDASPPVSHCPRCGAEFPLDTPEGLCPACLLAGAIPAPSATSAGDEPTLPSSVSGSSSGLSDEGPRLSPGLVFGPYRIGRLLGRGGMGEVYEAEQIEQGRRVALKVLGQRMRDPDDRARFLREGQLAASVSHPHTVYIFGSEVISGIPVIAMELLPGGTLKDRVKQEGPLAPAQAVDAILQVIAGLDAAQAAGILHRDIKPGNCFIDHDGSVKVGDFGLSISTLARDVSQLTMTGTFQGTPQYSSPEQLRGQPLDVRADIYAVGATLYYLLTGAPPFDERDLMALVTRVATEAPRSPRALRKKVPRGLAAIVLRCLAKDTASRPASYAALSDQLRPFSSESPTPATLGLRYAAGVIDQVLLVVLTLPLTSFVGLAISAPGSLTLTGGVGSSFWAKVAAFLYYSVLEGVGDASIGKQLCGLRVTGLNAQRAGLARAAGRALLFIAADSILELGSLAFGSSKGVRTVGWATAWVMVVPWLAPTALLFLPARRRNGFAGWHDLATRTRVVVRQKRVVRAASSVTRDPVAAARSTRRRCGPYEVVRQLGATPAGEMLVGFDHTLRRRVWLHTLPPGTPPIAPSLSDIGRPGRLRWLAGRRTTDDAWDAYEALDGAPLAVFTRAQPWGVVKHWLVDLAHEMHASAMDGSTPRLALDRVWITRANQAMLLDFGAPGIVDRAGVALTSPQAFLHAIATHAIGGQASGRSTAAPVTVSLPVSARSALEALAREEPRAMADVVTRVVGLAAGFDRVTRKRRSIAMALAGLPLAVYVMFVLIALPLLVPLMRQDVFPAIRCLVDLARIEPDTGAGADRHRTALETYVAARFGSMTAAGDAFWRNRATSGLESALRPLARRALAHHPSVSPDELVQATAELHAPGDDVLASDIASDLLVNAAELLMLVACFAAFLAFAFRGGVWFRMLGVATVTRNGAEASRRRALWRAFVSWSPTWLLAVCVAALRPGFSSLASLDDALAAHWVVILLAMGLLLACAVWAIVHPERGLQDRIAGTWLVPR